MQPQQSTYCGFDNNPIVKVDPTGNATLENEPAQSASRVEQSTSTSGNSVTDGTEVSLKDNPTSNLAWNTKDDSNQSSESDDNELDEILGGYPNDCGAPEISFQELKGIEWNHVGRGDACAQADYDFIRVHPDKPEYRDVYYYCDNCYNITGDAQGGYVAVRQHLTYLKTSFPEVELGGDRGSAGNPSISNWITTGITPQSNTYRAASGNNPTIANYTNTANNAIPVLTTDRNNAIAGNVTTPGVGRTFNTNFRVNLDFNQGSGDANSAQVVNTIAGAGFNVSAPTYSPGMTWTIGALNVPLYTVQIAWTQTTQIWGITLPATPPRLATLPITTIPATTLKIPIWRNIGRSAGF